MTETEPPVDFNKLVAEIQEAAEELQNLASLFLQEVDCAQGCDDTGNIVATIDSDNHIKESTIKPKWQHEIDKANLGDAWSQAVEAAKEHKEVILANLIDQAEKAGHPVAPVKPDRWPFEMPSGPPTRNVQQLIEDYLSYKAIPEGDSQLGQTEDDKVTVEANRLGFVWCHVDEYWAEIQAENQRSWLISSGVVEASEKAKEKLTQEPSYQQKALSIAYDAIRLILQL